jgi:hypothetical protein
MKVSDVPRRAEAGIVVLYVVVLAALAAVSGFMLGQRRTRWAAIAAGVALALLSAFVLRRAEISAGIGIPAVAAVLAISQAAYLIGLLSGGDQSRGARSLPREQVDDAPDESRDRDRQQDVPFHAAKFGERRDMSVR